MFCICFVLDDSAYLTQSFFVTSRIRDITSEERDSSSSDDVSISSSLQKSLFYIAVAFVIFFGLFSSTYFYKHCIKQTPLPDSKTIDRPSDQQEQYNMLVHASPSERENDSEPAYLEPISDVHYEEIVWSSVVLNRDV